MSLDFSLYVMQPCEVFSQNITHNLGSMAYAAGIYEALWRPEEIGAVQARHVISRLSDGLADLKARPDYFRQFDSPNGWGVYDHFVPFVESVLAACVESPGAEIRVSR